MKLTLALLFVVAGCQGCPGPAPTPSPGPVTTTLTVPVGKSTCASACARMAALGCPAASPTGGHTCEEVCLNVEKSGLALWGVACVTSATSCVAADACGGPL